MNFKSADLEKDWPRLRPLCCVPSAHSNPKGGAHVTQDSIANQNLHMDLPVRRGGGSSRSSLQAPFCNSAVMRVSVWCVLRDSTGCCERRLVKLRTPNMISARSSPTERRSKQLSRKCMCSGLPISWMVSSRQLDEATCEVLCGPSLLLDPAVASE